MPHSPRAWDGLDAPEPGPQPSRPSPAFGAPNIRQTTITPKEPDMADHSFNGGYGRQPIPTPPPQPPADQK